MATCTFDQLLFALRVSVEAANEALRRRRLAHYTAGDASGDALHVDVPRDARLDAPLESVVLPLYYNDRGRWIWMMKQSISKIACYFNTQRMMRRYAAEAYLR